MKPPALLGVGAVCWGGCLDGDGGTGAGGGGGGGGTSSLALGSACKRAISTVLRPLARGDVSGVCSISLKAVNIKTYIVNSHTDIIAKMLYNYYKPKYLPRRFDLTVMLRCVVPLRISSARA